MHAEAWVSDATSKYHSTSAQTLSFCIFTADDQSRNGIVGAFAVRLGADSDVILAQAWCKASALDMLYAQDCLQMPHCTLHSSTVGSSSHRLLCHAANPKHLLLEVPPCSVGSP